MDKVFNDVNVVSASSVQASADFAELSDAQLVLVGGGIGDIIVA